MPIVRHFSLLQLGVGVLLTSGVWDPGVLPNTPRCTGQPYSKDLSGPKCHTEAEKPQGPPNLPLSLPLASQARPPTSVLPRFSSSR